ncbi:MAG TPA: ABC transporter permease [Rhizomicrobium sp.]|nr:ABC transporter permease [Rhizomicrobium sp.]
MFADIRTQLNVIAALAIRDLQNLMKGYNYGFAWALLEPIMFIGLMRVARSAFKGLTPPNMPPSTFLILGIVPFYMYVQVIGSVYKAVSTQDQLLQFPRVTPVDIAIASAISDFCIYFTLYTLFLTFFSIYEGAWPPQNALEVFSVFILLWAVGVALGFVVGTAARVFPPLKQFISYYNLVNRMLGGMLFVITMLPSSLWPYFTWNPILHCMEMLRDGWFVTYTSPVADPAYVLEWLLGLLLLGLSLERFQRRVPYI